MVHCAQCGSPVEQAHRFCLTCGSALPGGSRPTDPTAIESFAPGPLGPGMSPAAVRGNATPPTAGADKGPRRARLAWLVAGVIAVLVAAGAVTGIVLVGRSDVAGGGPTVPGGVTPAAGQASSTPSRSTVANMPRPQTKPGPAAPASEPATDPQQPDAPPALPGTVTVQRTLTATAEPPPGPVTVVQTVTTTAKAVADPEVGLPRLDPGCDGRYIAVLATYLDTAEFAAILPDMLAAHPDLKYLYTGGSCYGFKSANAYALFDGPFTSVEAACAARFAGTLDAYVRVADPTHTDPVGCFCPQSPNELPVLAQDGSAGTSQSPYVAETQQALDRLELLDENSAGTFTAATTAAVMAFQWSQGLPATGVVDDATWSALIAVDCGR